MKWWLIVFDDKSSVLILAFDIEEAIAKAKRREANVGKQIISAQKEEV